MGSWTSPIRTVQSTPLRSKLDSICAKCRGQQFRQITQSRQMAESLNIVDHPARLVRVNKKHGPGLIILGMFNAAICFL
jgi:surfeit locus 1 family protein